MPKKSSGENLGLDALDDFIHEPAAIVLLSGRDTGYILTQGKYAYRVRGGSDGYLYYKKGTGDNWVLIANWCFYGLYIVVRYRKPVWLRPMYQSLFAKMNFASVTFHDHSIELVTSNGEILKGGKFRLSPPFAVDQVMSERFGYTPKKVEELVAKLHL